MNAELNKQGQLMVVVVGFFATVQLLLVQATTGSAPLLREGVTLALALGCAVRYWWVILVLPWPFRVVRTLLLLLAWSALPVIAMTSESAVRWGLSVAALSAIGCVTEVYNTITKQWMAGSEPMMTRLKRDHVIGAASAGTVTVCVVTVALLQPMWLDVLILILVLADWARLIGMVRAHRRIIGLGYPP